MMTNIRRYLLLQSIENSNNYAFVSNLEILLKEKIRAEHLLVIDNYSDSTSMGYARQFLKDAQHTIIIINAQNLTNHKNFTSILNQFIRNPKKNILCVTNAVEVEPILKMLKAEIFKNETALMNKLNYLISNESASL